MKNKKEIFAGIVIIGNEILSGRTVDTNTSTLSIWLNSLGIKVQEVKTIPDIEKTIITTVNEFYYCLIAALVGTTAESFIGATLQTNDGDNSNRYGIAIQTGSDTGSGTNYLLGFQDGDGNSIGSITFSGGTVSYNPFTASHPCIVPNSDNDKNSTANAYPYGTLLETTSIGYTQKDGANTERGIVYNVQTIHNFYRL